MVRERGYASGEQEQREVDKGFRARDLVNRGWVDGFGLWWLSSKSFEARD